MNFVRLEYTTGDRSLRVDFVFMDCGPAIGWRVYIISSVDYRGRSSAAYATHRSHDAGETYDYICWRGRISTLQQAKAIASLWADTISIYVRSNESFDTIASRLKNK